MSDSLRPHGMQHARLFFPSLSPEVCSDSRLLSQWCHPTISTFIAEHKLCASRRQVLRGLNLDVIWYMHQSGAQSLKEVSPPQSPHLNFVFSPVYTFCSARNSLSFATQMPTLMLPHLGVPLPHIYHIALSSWEFCSADAFSSCCFFRVLPSSLVNLIFPLIFCK